MSKAHSDAVLALLTGVSGLTVYDGKVPNLPALPYAVLFTDDGLEELDTLEATTGPVTCAFTLTASGLTRTSAQAASGKAHAALNGQQPTVAGRICSPIRQTTSRPITRDDDVDPPLLFAANQYTFFSVVA